MHLPQDFASKGNVDKSWISNLEPAFSQRQLYCFPSDQMELVLIPFTTVPQEISQELVDLPRNRFGCQEIGSEERIAFISVNFPPCMSQCPPQASIFPLIFVRTPSHMLTLLMPNDNGSPRYCIFSQSAYPLNPKVRAIL